jgi:hypothetical protein
MINAQVSMHNECVNALIPNALNHCYIDNSLESASWRSKLLIAPERSL